MKALLLYLMFNILERMDKMATKEELRAAIAEEKAEFEAALQEALHSQDAKIKELEDKIAAGGNVTAADLDAIRDEVKAMYTKPANPAPGTVDPA